VELKSLTVEDFIRILKEPKNALAKQYTALLETEGIKLILTKTRWKRWRSRPSERSVGKHRAPLAHHMEKMLEEVSFAGPD